MLQEPHLVRLSQSWAIMLPQVHLVGGNSRVKVLLRILQSLRKRVCIGCTRLSSMGYKSKVWGLVRTLKAAFNFVNGSTSESRQGHPLLWGSENQSLCQVTHAWSECPSPSGRLARVPLLVGPSISRKREKAYPLQGNFPLAGQAMHHEALHWRMEPTVEYTTSQSLISEDCSTFNVCSQARYW